MILSQGKLLFGFMRKVGAKGKKNCHWHDLKTINTQSYGEGARRSWDDPEKGRKKKELWCSNAVCNKKAMFLLFGSDSLNQAKWHKYNNIFPKPYAVVCREHLDWGAKNMDGRREPLE